MNNKETLEKAASEHQIERNKEDFKTFWDAACAFTIGSHKDFKQTHLDFEEFYQKFKQENNGTDSSKLA